jgi:hypothetical protein
MGWIAISVSGPGYLYPWTFRDVLNRLEGTPEIHRIMEMCRSFWPAPSLPPEPDIVELRRQVAELWPYDDFARSWDWYWGLHESG